MYILDPLMLYLHPQNISEDSRFDFKVLKLCHYCEFIILLLNITQKIILKCGKFKNLPGKKT